MYEWEFFLPFYSSTNKHNHAKHGSCYVHQIRNRDSLHSGDEIIFSVQSQARYNLQTAVDQQGEQSLHKAVTKWTMGRVDQTQNSLLQICNIREQYNEYNCTRSSQILKSESRKSNIVAVLENEFVNMFDIALDRTMLVNLSSGWVIETPTKLQNLQQDGNIIAKELLQEWLLLSSKRFFDSIPRDINISTMKKKYILQKKNKLSTAEVNRGIVGDPLHLTMKSGQVIGFKEALRVPIVSHTTESGLSRRY